MALLEQQIQIPHETQMLIEVINKHNMLVGEIGDLELAMSQMSENFKEISESFILLEHRIDNLSKSLQPIVDKEYKKRKK